MTATYVTATRSLCNAAVLFKLYREGMYAS